MTRIHFALILLAALIAETLCVIQSYFTLGLEAGLALTLLVGLNLIVILLYARGQSRAAVATLLLLVIAIVPYQLYLGGRWHALQVESQSIIAYAEQVRAERGHYPLDLADYPYRAPELAPYLELPQPYHSADHFVLAYRVTTPAATHMYFASREGWTVVP